MNAVFLKSFAANIFFNEFKIFASSVSKLGRLFPRIDQEVRTYSIDFDESISLSQIIAYEDDENLNKLHSKFSPSRMRKLMDWKTYQIQVVFFCILSIQSSC